MRILNSRQISLRETKLAQETLKDDFPFFILFKRVKTSEKDRGLEVSITYLDIKKLWFKQRGKCSYSGVELVLPENLQDYRENIVSIDRIDSRVGYIRENIQMVHRNVNYMKGILEEGYFLSLCTLIANNLK